MIGSIYPLVRLDQVSKRYSGTTVLEGISLEIAADRHLALLGPSGSGKSTLIRLIAGLEPPDAGRVWIQGRLASAAGQIRVPPHRREIAIVFQDLALWPNLTVLENVVLGLAGSGLARNQCRERAGDALENCRIAPLAGRRPEDLSGGERQRTALARALAVRPKVLLLDEPFAAVDLALKRHLYREVRELANRFGVTCLLVSHDPLEATALCSEAAVLEDGRVSEHGSLDQLLENPVSETMREFVAQLPQRNDRKGKL